MTAPPDPPADVPAAPPRRKSYRITLLRRPHAWSFTFASEDAARILARIAELAADPAVPFDEADAELVRDRMGPSATAAISPQTRPKSADVRG